MSLDLTLYRTFIEGCERRAASGIDSMIAEFMAEFPNATPEDVQAFTLEAMDLQLGIWGDAASARALEMFDEVCEREGIPATSKHFDVIEMDKVQDALHYACTLHLKKMDNDQVGYRKRCRMLMESYVHRCAWDSVVRNCEENRVRWARVPTGFETCAWCLMLASRGFDYLSSDTARAGNHNGCDCMVVPGKKGTAIEGYDPDAMYASWAQMADELGVDVPGGSSAADRAARNKALDQMSDYMRLKDPEWVYQGKTPKVRYTKPRDALEPHERIAVDLLQRAGFAVETLPEDPQAPANLDVSLGDSSTWEIKNVSNAKGSVKNQLTRSRKKFYKLGEREKRHVITGVGSSASFSETEKRLRELVRDDERIILLWEDGSTALIRK